MKRIFFFLFFCFLPLQAQQLPENFNPNAPGQNNQGNQNPGGANPNLNVPAPPRPPVDGRVVRTRYNTLARSMNEGKVPADPQNMALLRFKMEQARLWILEVDNNTAWPDEAMRNAQDAIARAEIVAAAKGDAVFPAPTQEHERAYIADNDGSVQPYWVYVPKNYTPTKKYPLVVFLHGYSPYISKISPWVPDESIWSFATERGFIFAVPYGRRNTDFVGIGEDDTVMVTNLVKERYSVEADRVFLMGASMGGYGVYAVGLHQPDIWAGLMPIAARTDFYLWFGLDKARVPFWKRALYDANDPRHLAGNALHLPIFLQHGALDDINVVAHPRNFVADAKVLGVPIKYREIKDGDHYIYFDSETYTLPLDWALATTRQNAPRKVRYTTGDLKNHRAYWVDIRGFENYGQSATITAQVGANNALEVQAQNIARFKLQPPKEHLKANVPLTLTVNGAKDARQWKVGENIEWPGEPTALKAEAAAETEKEDKPVAAFPGRKSPLRCGPIKNCYRAPFLVVYGTQKQIPVPNPANANANANANNANAAAVMVNPDFNAARRFFQEWADYADGLARVKADKDMTEADRRDYNLILIGTRDSNSVLAEISDKLPVELLTDGYRLGEKKVTLPQIADTGLQFCYPSPFDEKRMVVVQSGLYWGGKLPPNHKFDLLPDYIVYSLETEPGAAMHEFDFTDETNRALVAGYFDENWQLSKN